jgi:mannan endo-1,4-beta-mannosidase
MSNLKITSPVNPNASEEVVRVMEYLGAISGKGIITVQHTRTRAQPELEYIQKITGKLPALLEFPRALRLSGRWCGGYNLKRRAH